MTATPPPRARHASVTAPAIAPDAARLAQVLARDPDADGRFWYGVRSTGVLRIMADTRAEIRSASGNDSCSNSGEASSAR